MRKRLTGSAVAVAGAMLALGALATPAMADGGGGGGGGGGRPCGQPVSTNGTGTLGSSWKLKSMYDDNTAGQVVIGEEFEIVSPAGQVWTVTYTDNGTPFFSSDVTATATGVRVVEMTLYHGGTSHMAAHAVNKQSGEVIDGAVNLPVAPPACGTVVP
jgi:hypothetical protein